MPVEGMKDIDKYFILTDFNKYIGTSLGALEHGFPIKYKNRVALTKPGGLVNVAYSFPDNYTLVVTFSEVKYTNYNSKSHKWDFRHITKEKVSGIKIEHKGTEDYYCKEF